MSMRAILIPADHEAEATEVEVDARNFTSLSDTIGCDYVEFVRTADPNHRIVVDEMGLMKQRATLNRRASRLYPTGVIVGDVLVVGWDESQSYSMDEDATELIDATLALDVLDNWLEAYAR